MGIIRLILAISVLSLHRGPILGCQFVGGMAAVQAFYLISGFYMALILHKKYVGPGSYKLFLTNRLMKLMPTYWGSLVLLLLVAVAGYFAKGDLILSDWIESWTSLPLGLQIGSILSNLFILGQDIFFFVGFNTAEQQAFLELNYPSSEFPLHHLMLIGPAWTVSLEIMFYLLAPYFVRFKTRWLLALVILSLVLRICMATNGYVDRPWNYQFFPFELAFFLSGILLYRWYVKLRNQELSNFQNIGKVLTVVLLLVISFYQSIPMEIDVKRWIFYVFFALSLPFIFEASKKNVLDRKIGELSYPIYLFHIVLSIVLAQVISSNSNFFGLALALFSIAFSLAFNFVIVSRIETFRQQRVSTYTRKNAQTPYLQ